MTMMELLVQDFSYSSIVSDLNEKGFRMRDGRPWNRVALFNMTPRLIEVARACFLPRSGEGCGRDFLGQGSRRFRSLVGLGVRICAVLAAFVDGIFLSPFRGSF